MAIAISMLEIEHPGAKVQLALVAKNADGSGRVGASFDSAEFFDDVARVMGFDDLRHLMTSDAPDGSEGES
jgi:hypothetical protein